MESAGFLQACAVAGLTLVILGGNWFVQAKVLGCPTEEKDSLAKKLKRAGLVMLWIGVFLVFCSFVTILWLVITS